MSHKVIVFTSPTCGPCKRLKPELINQSEARGFKLEIVELSNDNRHLFAERGVRAVPVTMLVDENEVEVDRVPGLLSTSSIEAKLNEWGL